MLTFKSLGWSPSNYTKNHIRSLEFGQKHGGISDTNTKVLEVLYAIQDVDLKNASVGNELNKYLSNSVNKLLYDEKNKTGSIETNNLLYTKPKASEYVSFQREIEQSSRDSALSLSI